MTIFRWLCIIVCVVCALEIDLDSASVWQHGLAPLGMVLCFFMYLFSYPLERYRQSPATFAAEAKEAKRKANERGTSYDGGAD